MRWRSAGSADTAATAGHRWGPHSDVHFLHEETDAKKAVPSKVGKWRDVPKGQSPTNGADHETTPKAHQVIPLENDKVLNKY